MEETAEARAVRLEAEAKLALAWLADTRAECSEQHKIMTAELEAMQCSVKENFRANNQQQTMQSAKVDAMRYRLEEMKDLILQHKLRMEVQMAELNTRMHTLSAAAQGEKPKLNTPTSSDTKVVPLRPLTLS